MICTDETNFCRVFRLPESYPAGFCFGGGYPVTFQLVDWFNPVPHDKQDQDWDQDVLPMLLDFLRPKPYVQPGKTYLVITDFGKSFTFTR